MQEESGIFSDSSSLAANSTANTEDTIIGSFDLDDWDDLNHDDDFEDLPLLLTSVDPLFWRIEILGRGKYWIWRRRGTGNRESRYGGTTDLLPNERMEQYERNKQTHSRTKKKKKNPKQDAKDRTSGRRDGIGDVEKRSGISSTGERHHSPSPRQGRITYSA